MKEALYYTRKNESLYCLLCPHYCKLREGEIGKCMARKNIGGKLYTLNYGKITSYGFDPIEKKPLYHFFPGSRIFSFGTFGCNFRCDFCQNWKIVEDSSQYIEINNSDLLKLASLEDSIGIAYTYNEPSIFYEMVFEMAKKVKENAMKNILVTNGFLNRKPLEELLPYIDAMNIDLKSMNDQYYKRLCGGSLDPVLKTIELAAKKTHVELTSLIIDGENSSEEEMDKMAGFIANIDKNIPLHLSKYFPQNRMDNPPTSLKTLKKLRDVAKNHLNYVYIGNVAGINNDTLCPNCGNTLVTRNLNAKLVGLTKNHCNKCGEKIAIVL